MAKHSIIVIIVEPTTGQPWLLASRGGGAVRISNEKPKNDRLLA